jgi:protein-tyrosine phosphatase
VLLEVPFSGVGPAFLVACRHVRSLGYGLLIAHPERAAGFSQGGLRLLQEELAAGALLQVNACSLLGRHGDEARAAAVQLVAGGLAYVVASDGHGWGERAHSLRAGAEQLGALGLSEEQIRRLIQRNPRLLLRHGIPQTPSEGLAPWQPMHAGRVRHAVAAAQRRRGAPRPC